MLESTIIIAGHPLGSSSSAMLLESKEFGRIVVSFSRTKSFGRIQIPTSTRWHSSFIQSSFAYSDIGEITSAEEDRRCIIRSDALRLRLCLHPPSVATIAGHSPLSVALFRIHLLSFLSQSSRSSSRALSVVLLAASFWVHVEPIAGGISICFQFELVAGARRL